jgi:hypothetical protein
MNSQRKTYASVRSGLQMSLALTASVLFAQPSTALAATRTVCFEMFIRDNARTNCPGPGTAGQRRECQPASTWQYAVGWWIELWDKDAGAANNDEYIGTWRIGAPGAACVTFEWENAGYSLGEAHPDVYLKLDHQVQRASNNGTIAYLVDQNSLQYGQVSWRDGSGGNPSFFVANDCIGGITCSVPNGMAPTDNTGTTYGQALLALDSAQLTVDMYDDVIRTDFNVEFPTNKACPTACAWDRTTIAIPAGLATDGGRTAHEAGHVIQLQNFEQDAMFNNWACVGGTPSAGWGPAGFETYGCATNEGWAMAAGGGAWWSPGNTGSIPFYLGFDMEAAAPTNGTCANNGLIPGQVARAFWDVMDANNENGAGITAGWNDTLSWGATAVAAAWDFFPDGTANRQDRENHVNGVNVRDYDGNIGVDDNTLINHNCLQSQDN